MTEPEFQPITVRVVELCRISGLCRDKVFELLKSGAIDSFKCGKLRLISIESYRRWMDEQIRRDKSITNGGTNGGTKDHGQV
jgi:hypothetical protein